MKTQERKEQNKPIGVLTRDLPQSQAKVDMNERTLTFPFSSTRAVDRFVWYDENLPEGASSQFSEVISHDPAHWRLERVEEGVCPYLKDHYGRLGRVLSVSFEGDRAFATVKLRRSSDADQELSDIEDGTGGFGASFGYRVYRYRVLEPAVYKGEGWDRELVKPATLEAIDLELFEISNCTMPADPTVGFGKSAIDLRTIQIEGDPNWTKPKPEARSTRNKSKEKPVVTKQKTKAPVVQRRELMLSDYLTAESPTWADMTAAFENTIAAIDDAAANDDTTDTEALYQGAIADLAAGLYALYEVPAPEAETEDEGTSTAPMNMMSEERAVKPTEQETERDRQFRAMQDELQQVKRRDHVTRQRTTLRQQAEVLKSKGKLTPAYFKAKFPEDFDAAIDLYTKADESKLASLKEQLDDLEKYAPAVEFGSKLDNEPLELEARSASQIEKDRELEAYKASRAKK